MINREQEFVKKGSNGIQGDNFVSNPLDFITSDFEPYVCNIEKPTESYDDLWRLAQKFLPEEPDYKITRGIVSCSEVATSISPYAFNCLSEDEKNLVAKFPNSDMALALLQKNSFQF